MSKKYLTHINLNKNELQNAVIQPLASAPSSPSQGQIYFDTTLGKYGVYNGTAWVYMGSSEATGDVSSNTSLSVDGEIAVFSGAGGKTIKRATGSGLAKLTNGVLSTATAGTDYLTSNSTTTLSNKTINTSNNTITGIGMSNFSNGLVNASTTLADATDSNIPTSLAVKTFVNDTVGAINGVVFKGGIDATANPNYPVAKLGDMYKITGAGKIGGASGKVVEVNDTIIATADNAGGTQATVGSSWIILQANVEGATTTTAGLVALATSVEASAKTNSTKAVTPSALTGFPLKKTFTVGNGTNTSIVVTHNLNTTDVITQVRLATGDEVVECDISNTSVNTITLGFATAPASNSIKVVIIG